MTTSRSPELSLVVLVGVSGSGKSTFAARHFRPTEVLSSDVFRGLVGDDENDQSVTAAAFEALHAVAAKRLARQADRGRRHQRAAGRPPAAGRAGPRAPRAAGGDRARRARADLRAAQRGPPGPGVRRQRGPPAARASWQVGPAAGSGGVPPGVPLRGVPRWRAARIVRGSRPGPTVRTCTGPSTSSATCTAATPSWPACWTQLGYQPDPDGALPRTRPGAPRCSSATWSTAGPDTPGVLRTVMGMVAAGAALCVSGQPRGQAAARAARPRRHGQPRAGRVAGPARAPSRTSSAARSIAFLDGLVSHYVLD